MSGGASSAMRSRCSDPWVLCALRLILVMRDTGTCLQRALRDSAAEWVCASYLESCTNLAHLTRSPRHVVNTCRK